MEAEIVRQCLAGIGCTAEQVNQITEPLSACQLPDAWQKMRVMRCELIEEMHCFQRRIDQLDWLIRSAEKEMDAK